MALESILFRRYTHQSDVWSYGESMCRTIKCDCKTLHFGSDDSIRGHSISRCDSLGNDVIWGGALLCYATTRSTWSVRERGTPLSTSDLHHRCLHGHGQMWVEWQWSCASSHLSSLHSRYTFLQMLACKVYKWKLGLHNIYVYIYLASMYYLISVPIILVLQHILFQLVVKLAFLNVC